MISLQFLYRNARSQEKGIVCRRITCFNWRSPKPSNAWEGETALDENFINFSSNKPQGEQLQNKSRGELQRKLRWKGNNACKYPALPTLLKVKCNSVLRLENKNHSQNGCVPPVHCSCTVAIRYFETKTPKQSITCWWSLRKTRRPGLMVCA